jgi:hypothetical protein
VVSDEAEPGCPFDLQELSQFACRRKLSQERVVPSRSPSAPRASRSVKRPGGDEVSNQLAQVARDVRGAIIHASGHNIALENPTGGRTIFGCNPDVAPGGVFIQVGGGVAASRKAVRAPSSAASSGSIDSIICVRSRPPCSAANVDNASVRGSA